MIYSPLSFVPFSFLFRPSPNRTGCLATYTFRVYDGGTYTSLLPSLIGFLFSHLIPFETEIEELFSGENKIERPFKKLKKARGEIYGALDSLSWCHCCRHHSPFASAESDEERFYFLQESDPGIGVVTNCGSFEIFIFIFS